MDADQGKLFVGGISWETSEEKLKEYFGQYGDVLHANIMRDKTTGRPRGFGFVHFSDPSVLDRVVQDKHSLDGRSEGCSTQEGMLVCDISVLSEGIMHVLGLINPSKASLLPTLSCVAH